MKSKKVLMSKKHAIVLIIILFVALILIGKKVFTDLYKKGVFQNEIAQVPDMYVEMNFDTYTYNKPDEIMTQKIKAKLLHVDWLYNEENTVVGEHVDDPKDLEFSQDETMYVIQYDNNDSYYHFWPSYYLYTEPKYLMTNTVRASYNSKYNPRMNSGVNNPQIFNREYIQKEQVVVSGSNTMRIENWLFDTTYIKQGYAQYGMKVVYFGCDPLIVKDYIECNTTDNEKIKQILSKLFYSDYLEDAWIDGSTLNVKYKYFTTNADNSNIYANNMLLFACLKNIDKIVYTADHTKTFIIKYDENSGNPYVPTTEYGELDKLEFTREEFNNKFGITLDDIKNYIERSGK